MVSTTVQTILDNLTSLDNWTLAIGAAENASLLNLTNSSFVPKINGFDDGPQFPAYIRTPSMVLCSIILCIGVLGNIMVPCVILKSKDMRNSTNIFLMNLSIADLMVLLVCTPTVLVEVNSKPETWQMGEHMCKAVPFVELTVAHASVLTILAISFERYYAICEPLKAGYVCTKTRAIVICLLAWGFAALFTSPITWITEYKHTQYFDNSIVPVCLTQAEKIWPATYFVLIILVFFILPLILLIVLYAIIAKNLMAEINNTNDNNMYNQRARRQVVTMLALVVLSFFLCLLPFRIITLWIVIIPDDNVYSIKKLTLITYYKVLFVSRILLYLNSAINPILYNIMSSKFRKGFKKLIGIRHVNNRKFTYTGTLTTTLNSSHQSSTRRLLMTQKSTPNLYNDDNSFKNKNLYRQSTDSMLFDRSKNKNLLLLKNSGSFQTKSKDIDELLNKTCRQCGHKLEEFCKNCRKIVNKSLLEQHTKAKKVCHCEQNLEKTGKTNYLYCKNCEIFVNNRLNKPKHSLDASLSTCSKLPINILIQTFDSFDSSPLLLKKFNDEKQKEKMRKALEENVNDDTKDAHQPLLDKSDVCRDKKTPMEPKDLSRDYDNLTDIEEETLSSAKQNIHDNSNLLVKTNKADQLDSNISSNEDQTSHSDTEYIELKEFDVKESDKMYDIPKIPVTEEDRRRDKFSSILKKGNKKLVTKRSNVSFDLENLNRVTTYDSNESLNVFSEKLPKKDDGDSDERNQNNQQGRFSIHRTSIYDNVDTPHDTLEKVDNESSPRQSTTKPIDGHNADAFHRTNNMDSIHSESNMGSLQDIPSIDYEEDTIEPDPPNPNAIHDHEIHSKANCTNPKGASYSRTLLDIDIVSKTDTQPNIICDRNLHSKISERHCDRGDPHFDEINKKIQSSIQILSTISSSCSSTDSSNKTDQSGCSSIENIPPHAQLSKKHSRNLSIAQAQRLVEPNDLVAKTNQDLTSAVTVMSPVLEELSPICDNLFSAKIDQTIPESKIPNRKPDMHPMEKAKINTGNSDNIQTSIRNDLQGADKTNSKQLPHETNNIDYTHCNGRSAVSHQTDLKSPPKCAKSSKFQSNLIKKTKNKKSYDDIRIEMKRRRSRKKPKLRRENSFDLGDLDLVSVPPAPDLLAPFSYSNSENDVKDLITSQTHKGQNSGSNVLINLFDMKDSSNEETFV
uniref:Neuropeptide receptor n=2 Tax=Diaphorina citri TaxID=121845 RepID=A0A2U9PG19_DIACI|nr:neuropeptide receptor [Diaphorina citri]